jgi:glycine cleavage system H protein
MNIPENYRYTQDHEYVKADGNTVTIGVTDYAQGQLGDIIYVDFTKSAGETVNAGDTVCSIEAVKTVSEVFTPVSGKITEINTAINDKAAAVNEDPYGEGWLFKIEMSNTGELDSLLDSKAYSGIIS